MRVRFALVPVFLCALGAANGAYAQMDSREGIALQNQILELRAQVQQMQQQGQGGGYGGGQAVAPPIREEPPAGGGAPLNTDTAAQLVVRVGNLEEQNRELQGKLDDLTNQLQRQNDQFAKQLSDLQFKLGQAPGGGQGLGGQGSGSQGSNSQGMSGQDQAGQGTEPAFGSPDEPAMGEQAPVPRPQAKPVVQPPPPPPRRTPEMALHEGNAALARRDYPAAAASAREVLAGHGVRSADAQFLLARAESGQHQYREAAADFYVAYNHAPRSGTAPVALLGVANSLIEMKDNGDACQALQKLTTEFPHPAGGLRASVESARRRAACR